MVKKDFNKGIEVGSKIFEEKFKEQSEVIDRVGATLSDRLDEFSDINDVIIDDLTSMEKNDYMI